jgi:hypothetical protein
MLAFHHRHVSGGKRRDLKNLIERDRSPWTVLKKLMQKYNKTACQTLANFFRKGLLKEPSFINGNEEKGT